MRRAVETVAGIGIALAILFSGHWLTWLAGMATDDRALMGLLLLAAGSCLITLCHAKRAWAVVGEYAIVVGLLGYGAVFFGAIFVLGSI